MGDNGKQTWCPTRQNSMIVHYFLGLDDEAMGIKALQESGMMAGGRIAYYPDQRVRFIHIENNDTVLYTTYILQFL